jgi:hypothetical protein
VIGSPSAIKIVAVEDHKAINDWLAVPRAVFADDPAWVQPLDFLERRRISRRHAPFFTFGDAALFLAYRGDRPVGRISAQINRRHLDYHRDSCGHFGFFDCCNDPEAAQALVDSAAEWVRGRGMKRMAGPLSFSVNEECGCLVSGFDTPPAILMPHARTWTGRLLEGAGLAKEVDLYAYRIAPDKLSKRIIQIGEFAKCSSGVSIRQLDMKHYADEVHTLIDIFNDAWSGNWGFVPFSKAEIDALLAEMRPLFRGHYGRLVLLNDQPVAFMLGMPNINEAIARYHGRILPFNWLKLWWLLKHEAIPTARVPLLGVRKAYQSTPMGSMFLALLISEFVAQMLSHNLRWVEFSWIVETNKPMIKLAEAASGPPVKTYRIYRRTL